MLSKAVFSRGINVHAHSHGLPMTIWTWCTIETSFFFAYFTSASAILILRWQFVQLLQRTKFPFFPAPLHSSLLPQPRHGTCLRIREQIVCHLLSKVLEGRCFHNWWRKLSCKYPRPSLLPVFFIFFALFVPTFIMVLYAYIASKFGWTHKNHYRKVLRAWSKGGTLSCLSFGFHHLKNVRNSGKMLYLLEMCSEKAQTKENKI